MRGSRLLPLAPVGGDTPVLCLAATVNADVSDEMVGAVLARVAEMGRGVHTVVLSLDGDIDARCREALDTLHRWLRRGDIGLRLVVAPEVRRSLRRSGADPLPSSLPVHPTTRSAVLAIYAALPGPGLVTGRVRAALSAPAQPLNLPASENLTLRGQQEAIGDRG